MHATSIETVLPLMPRNPSHADLISFFQKYLPPSIGAKEVPFLYHSPRQPTYDPVAQQVRSVVLSITPTSGFYSAIDNAALPLSFLHRPWALNRRALKPGSVVLASHASFDEHLTVGWNVHLARRVGLDIDNAICIQGYKDNPDRKIGLVARFVSGYSMPLDDLVSILRTKYEGSGELRDPNQVNDQLQQDEGGVRLPSEIRLVAIMNAFHDDEIQRVLSTVRERGWLGEVGDASTILYLTGAAREYGLEAAQKVNMPAFCVGHRACEEWGIKFLGSELRQEWPGLNVVEVLEEEELPPPNKKTLPERNAESAV